MKIDHIKMNDKAKKLFWVLLLVFWPLALLSMVFPILAPFITFYAADCVLFGVIGFVHCLFFT